MNEFNLSEKRKRNNSGQFTSEGQRGEKHYKWKGEMANDKVKHRFVEKRKPKPDKCPRCGEDKRLALANIKNHNYTKNPDDYEWMCYKCHNQMDSRSRFKSCKRGHPFKGENLITTPGGKRICRECRRIYQKNYRSKKNE